MPPEQAATVLVVEDDADLLELIRHVLAAPGRTVLGAPNGEDALRVAVSAPVDVLLCDIQLPDVSGVRVAELVRLMHPGVQVLYMSGWHDHPTFPDLGGDQLLKKPFLHEALEEAVAAALERSG